MAQTKVLNIFFHVTLYSFFTYSEKLGHLMYVDMEMIICQVQES